jgi:hypothetical protein
MGAHGYDDYFEEEIWQAMLEKHNSILITDISPEVPNEPYRYLIDISQVKAIDFFSSEKIKWLIFEGAKDIYYYYTDTFYSVWLKDFACKIS